MNLTITIEADPEDRITIVCVQQRAGTRKARGFTEHLWGEMERVQQVGYDGKGAAGWIEKRPCRRCPQVELTMISDLTLRKNMKPRRNVRITTVG